MEKIEIDLAVGEVLMRGNLLAEQFAKNEGGEQDYIAIFDYSTDILLAKNCDELIGAMYCSLQENGVELDQYEQWDLIAAYVALGNVELFFKIKYALDGLLEMA